MTNYYQYSTRARLETVIIKTKQALVRSPRKYKVSN